jgi:hypothetical protein
MKTNNNENRDHGTTDQKTAEQKSEVGGQREDARAETPEQWWEELTAAEKRFAYDLNDVARGLVQGGFAQVRIGLEGAKRKLRAAVQRLSVAYDSAGVQSPGGGPERWRWN